MTKKEFTTTKAGVALASFVVSVASGAFLALPPFALSNSMGLSSAFITGQALSSGVPSLNAMPSGALGYELYSLFCVNQGVSNGKLAFTALFNPGADIDLTTTTDFEDLAAPAADIVEFTDQDRALAADYMSSTLLWNASVGGLLGVTAYAVLSPDFWRTVY